MSKVFLGMSGGVDSSVSAILLKEQGCDVTGIYMKNWSKDLPGMKCPWAEDLADAKRVAVQLDLDFEVWDFEEDYKRRVVDYMLSEFQKGRTPNPDVMCNEQIKFKLFYERAMERGADFIATGHYARVGAQEDREASPDNVSSLFDRHSEPVDKSSILSTRGESKRLDPVTTGVENAVLEKTMEHCVGKAACRLLRARDENKDQTYFLYRMSDEATAHTLFPVGSLLKPEVKTLAAEHGLDVATKKESMGVCFVGEVGMKDFLREYLDTKAGEIREIETDKVLGYHDGAIFYTIGQRHGLYLGGGLPYYVVQKDLAQNIVYVSRNLNHESLWTDELKLEDLHLRSGLTLESLAQISDLKVRLRHRATLLPVSLIGEEKGISDCGSVVSSSLESPATTGAGRSEQAACNESRRSPSEERTSSFFRDDARESERSEDRPARTCLGKNGTTLSQSTKLSFSSPIKRPASGQSAVLYSGETCLGGGIIAE